jgi:hypothetical protein
MTPPKAAVACLVEAAKECAAYHRGGRAALAAVDAWEKRGRLRDDPKLFAMVDKQLSHCAETEPLLDLIEDALFGQSEGEGGR